MKKRLHFIFFVLLFPFALRAGENFRPVDEQLFMNKLTGNANRIKDISARVNFHILITNLGLAFDAHGDFYYKQPDRMKLKLHGIPDFLAVHEERAFKAANVLAGLPKEMISGYKVSFISQRKLNGKTFYLVELFPRKAQNVSRILLWVDPAHYTTPEIIIRYVDGTMLQVKSHYVPYEKVYLVHDAETVYNFTSMKIQADITATFSHYRLNKGLSDAVFDSPKSNT